MKSWSGRGSIGLVGLFACALFAGCATTTVTRHSTDVVVDTAEAVVVVPPLIEYRDVHTNGPIESNPEDRIRVETALGELVRDQLTASGFTIRVLTADERRRFPVHSTGWTLCDESLPLRLLCIRGRFYVGPGAFYEPFTGGIKRGGSRIVLDARLSSTMDHRSLWAQTAQIRESTDVNRATLKDTVEVLLKTLKVK